MIFFVVIIVICVNCELNTPTILQVFGFLLIHLAQWNIFKWVTLMSAYLVTQTLMLKITSWKSRDTTQKARNEPGSYFLFARILLSVYGRMFRK